MTFTATVAPQFTGTPTGTVTFVDGTTILATERVSAGAAKFTTSKLASGAHTIMATYKGSTSYGMVADGRDRTTVSEPAGEHDLVQRQHQLYH